MQGRSIAVVEDERVIAEAVAARLRKEGFEAHTAGDGPAAIELCRTLRPDAVVLDLMLPGIDGLEVCREIQRDRHVPVLMLTARDSEADLLVGLGVGADDYMTKPFSMQELVARLRALLRRSGSSAAAGGGPPNVGELAVATAGACGDAVGGCRARLVAAGGALGRTKALPRAIVAVSAAAVLAFSVLNHEGLVADQNVDHYERTGKIDAGYLATLGPDATPALANLPRRVAPWLVERTAAPAKAMASSRST
ncbi:MAG: response regulator [Thermoleophilaceae bacterium]